MSDDAYDLLWGGGGPPALSFPTKGTTHEGRILRMETAPETDIDTGTPKLWSDGKPKMQLVLTLQTTTTSEEDDGQRRLFLKWKSLQAFRDALKAAGLQRGDSPLGGTLKIQYFSGGEPTGRGKHSPKEYRAHFTPGLPPEAEDLINSPGGPDDEIPF